MPKINRVMRAQIARALASRRRVGRYPRPRVPRGEERAYQKALHAIVGRIGELVDAHLTPHLPALAREFASARGEHHDADPMDAKRILDEIRKRLYEEFSEQEVKRIAERAGTSVSAFNKRVASEGLKRVTGIDVFFNEPWLLQEMQIFAYLNTQLITKMSTNALSEIESVVMQGFQAGLRHEEISKDIQARLGVAESRANLIARDQVSKLNGQLTKLRQGELGIKSYIWRTSLDDRVRDSHREKEGREFSWDDPPADTGHPGEDIQCRCTAEPILKDLDGLDPEGDDPQAWNIED